LESSVLEGLAVFGEVYLRLELSEALIGAATGLLLSSAEIL
jgi:hypothetical protein